MKSKYGNGMNRIRTGEEFRKAIVRRAVEEGGGTGKTFLFRKTGPQRPNAPKCSPTALRGPQNRRKAAVFAASCALLLLLAAGASIQLPNAGRESGSAGFYRNFFLTAYAADGNPIPVSPDAVFPLGRYSLWMSSVPGFPLTLGCTDAQEIRVEVSEGKLLSLDRAASKVMVLGKETAVDPGATLYWSPLPEGSSPSSPAKNITLELTAYKGGEKLGSSTVEIQTADGVSYTGKLSGSDSSSSH